LRRHTSTSVSVEGKFVAGSIRPWTMSSWLECGGQRFPLLPGANIIGRDSDLPVALNGTTVSRRHARIIVMADGVSIEDSGSKNGTFVGGVRAVSPVRLAHGDEIHIGALLLKFYVHRLEPATDETAVHALH
jgi:pSer/pThr/pTyr-binding forkhead associated (FHA) protein